MSAGRNTERALLGAVMRDGRQFEAVRDLIAPGDFSWQSYGWAWDACGRLHEAGQGIDAVTVGDELDRAGHLIEFATEDGAWHGRVALGKLREEGTPANVTSYAATVRDYAAKEQLRQIFATGASWAANGRQSHDIAADIERLMGQVRTMDRRAADHTSTLADAVSESYDHTVRASRGEIRLIKTGYTDLDMMLKGLEGGGVYCFAGRPGQGKSALLGSMIKNMISDGVRVALFTLEMTRREIAMRILAQLSGISVDRQRSGELEPKEWDRLNAAIETIEKWPLTINDLPRITPARIRQELRRIGQVDAVFVDYVQLADADERHEKRYLDVSAVMKGFKAIAKEFDIPVITAAQLSRAVEQRAEKRPVLSDLKESGGIEENSDVVAFIYRPDQYEKEAVANETEIIVAKHRNGRVGSVQIVYRPELTRFENGTKLKFNGG